MRQNPFRELARLRGIVIQRRNHQIRDLEPNFCFLLSATPGFPERVEDASA